MTDAQLKRCQAAFDLDGKQMAQLLGTSERTYYRWIAGRGRIAGTVDRYLTTLLKYPQVRDAVIAEVRG